MTAFGVFVVLVSCFVVAYVFALAALFAAVLQLLNHSHEGKAAAWMKATRVEIKFGRIFRVGVWWAGWALVGVVLLYRAVGWFCWWSVACR